MDELFAHTVLDRTIAGVHWEIRFRSGMSLCIKAGGETHWTGFWKPTIFRSSLGAYALRPVKEPVSLASSRIQLLLRPWNALSSIKAGKWVGWCQDLLQSALGNFHSPAHLVKPAQWLSLQIAKNHSNFYRE